MKNVLLYCLSATVFLMASGISKTYGQSCSVDSVTVKLNSALTVAGTCVINIDLSWDQDNNNGNKFTNIHLWQVANYPNYGYGTPPTQTQLANAIGTLVVVDPAAVTPTLGIVYPPDILAFILPASGVVKTVVSGSRSRFTITGITFFINSGCNNPIEVVADVWSSNAASDNAVQCLSANNHFFVNDPLATGSISCSPREFTVDISSLTNTPRTGTFIVYADLPPLGILDAGDPVIYISGTVAIPALGTYSSGPIAYNTYPNNNLWVRVTVTGNTYTTTSLINNLCLPLPVTLNTFSGQRQSNSQVLLKWGTSSEQNSAGFDVQRKTGNGSFESVGFVPTQATGGNSNSPLTYQFTDNNSSEDFTQYRLAQKDADGKLSLSNIIIVKGSKGAGLSMLIFPNPSPDGKVNMTFGDAMTKDIQVTDNSGKVVQQRKSVSSSQVTLTGLRSGMYFLSVTVQSTGESTTRKIVVQ